MPHADDDFGKTMIEIFSKVDAFLLGHKTYDLFSAHWPRVTDPNDPIAHKLNSLPEYVASRTRTEFSWNNSLHLGGVKKDAAVLKNHFSNELQVHGSCGLTQTLIQHDLIDEYRL